MEWQSLGIGIDPTLPQAKTFNPCKKAKCQQLCLLSPKKVNSDGFTCKCHPGYRLGDDGDCIDKGDPFLLVVKDNEIIDAQLMPQVWIQ